MGIAAASGPAELPRLKGLKVVFSLRQCDKENQGGCEGLARRLVLPKIRSANVRLHPSVKLASNETIWPVDLATPADENAGGSWLGMVSIEDGLGRAAGFFNGALSRERNWSD